MGKKAGSVAFILLMFLGSYTHIHAQVASTPLPHIANIMQKEDITVEGWHLYAKQKGRMLHHRSGYRRWVARIKAQFPLFQWSEIRKDRDGHLKVTGTRTDEHSDVEERFTVVGYPTGDNWETYQIYEMEGDRWNPAGWKEMSFTFRHRTSIYFPENPTIFTCATGKLNAKINLVLYDRARKLLHSFSAQPIEQLKEETFVSLSAYTDEWKQSIETRSDPMNLQVALRSLGDSAAQVTIGTPIITTEY